MQEEYSGRLLENGHLSIPKGIIDKLSISEDSKLHVTVKVLKKARKSTILAYAGLLSDLTQQEERQFDESIKRRMSSYPLEREPYRRRRRFMRI